MERVTIERRLSEREGIAMIPKSEFPEGGLHGAIYDTRYTTS